MDDSDDPHAASIAATEHLSAVMRHTIETLEHGLKGISRQLASRIAREARGVAAEVER